MFDELLQRQPTVREMLYERWQKRSRVTITFNTPAQRDPVPYLESHVDR